MSENTATQQEDTMATTATLNIIDGELTVHVPGSEDTDLAVVDGRTLPTTADLEPWGAEDLGFARADEALAGLGWRRVSEWVDEAGAGMEAAATVVPAQI